MEKLSIFSRAFQNVKQSFWRFPAMYFFAFVGAFSSATYFVAEKRSLVPLVLAAAWTELDCVFLSLLADFFGKKKARFIANVIPFAVFLCVYFWCKTWEDNQYFFLRFCATIFSTCLLCGFFLYLRQKEKTAANIFSSQVVAAIVQGCVSSALCTIFFAIDTLILDISEYWYLVSALSSFFIIYFPLFVMLATKNPNEIKIPKVIKFAFFYTLLPLFTIFIAVLYVYLVKSAVLREMPSNTINPFVSIATLAFIILRMTLGTINAKIVRFFRKWGAFALIPLVILQCVSWTIRVNAYGLTVERYASLLYIVFSILCLAFSILEIFGLKLEKFCWLTLAVLSIFACLPRVNLIDFPEFSQAARIKRTLEKKGLFENGKIDFEKASKILSDEEKEKICDSFAVIQKNRYKIDFLPKDYNDFWGKFGTIKKNEDYKNESFEFVDAKLEWLETTGFRRAQRIRESDWDGEHFFVMAGGRKVDVTAEVKNATKDEPLIIDREDFRIILTDASASTTGWSENLQYNSNVYGFVLEK